MTVVRAVLPQATPTHLAALGALAAAVDNDARLSGLPPVLLELVRIRASQLNGCGYCLGLHTRAARATGETEQRLRAIATWRDEPHFTAGERAALALAEAVTSIKHGVGDEVYGAAAEHFTQPQLAQLLWVISLINAYNRLAVSTRLDHASVPAP